MAADPTVRDRFRAEAVRLRGELAGVGGHRRVPATAADLLAALDLLLEFARAVGAASGAEADGLRDRGRRALAAVGAAQAEHLRDADPARRYLDLLRSALSPGRAHLATPDGGRPGDPAAAAGWRRDGDGWRAQGALIGWLADDRVCLDPEAAQAVVSGLAAAQGAELAVSARTLRQRLAERGVLVETDDRGGGAGSPSGGP